METQGILRRDNLAARLTTVAEVIVELVHVAEHEVLLSIREMTDATEPALKSYIIMAADHH